MESASREIQRLLEFAGIPAFEEIKVQVRHNDVAITKYTRWMQMVCIYSGVGHPKTSREIHYAVCTFG